MTCISRAGDISREKDLKPGGQPADFRSVSVMNALRLSADSDFKGLKQSWIGTLLQEGLLFREKANGKTFLSLGHVLQSLWLWEVSQVADARRGNNIYRGV